MSDPTSTKKVLLVDDDPSVLDLFRRVLADAGFEVACAANGKRAERILERQTFDVIVSDITMPEMSGVELLRAVRQRDLDVPVVLVTGLPDVDTAIEAVELGAMRYLVKPVLPRELLDVVHYGQRLHALTRVKREALAYFGKRSVAADRAGIEATFESAQRSLWVAFQPIVRLSRRDLYAHEALVRCHEEALSDPVELFGAAVQLGRVRSLGRQIRGAVADAMADLDESVRVFVNLHPLELKDDELYSRRSPLSRHADRVVLEISEQQPLSDIFELRERISELRAMGFGIAVDDLGAGYAGLGSFVHLAPDIAKLDHSLVRDIHREPVKHRLARSIFRLCADIGVSVVAEGVEVRAECEALEELGTDLFQGNVFARPGPAFPCVSKSAFDFATDRLLPL